jgi:secreted Zn-dependent insulinase-like peptidase
MRGKVANMTDEQFQTVVKAVLIGLEQKDKNLQEVNVRFYTNEIGCHRYHFDRQQREIAEIKTIERKEFQAYFESFFITEVRRVDFRYNSKAHMEQEAKGEFKFEKEKQYASAFIFKKAMDSWHPDRYKQRYSEKKFKL